MLQYVAVLLQTGPNPPTPNVGINTFTATPEITRLERGRYKIQYNVDLSQNNTVLLCHLTINGYPFPISAFIDDGCVMLWFDNEDFDNVVSLDVRWFGD